MFSQTRNIDLPANSSFAVAMRTQQEAEKAEQQRIKKLVLNYDMHAEEDATELPSNGNSPSPAMLYSRFMRRS